MDCDVKHIEGGHPIDGVDLGVASAGLKGGDKPDLVFLRLPEGCRTAAVFTRNAFTAAPVEIARDHLAKRQPRVLLINAGCANAGTGRAGHEEAQATCSHAAAQCGGDPAAVLPFSTGVIGQRLAERAPMAAIESAIATAADSAGPGRWLEAARAIMTTDTWPKVASRTVRLSGGAVTVTGMAKGSGMIRPDMATMLAFIATDALVEAEALDALLREAVEGSFHRITVDGDTSTNDAVTLSATGTSGVGLHAGDDRGCLAQALTAVSLELAQAIVRDAEGASRTIAVRVEGGHDESECRDTAFTVAHSPLVKTALFGADPNWGRILAAVGRAPIHDLDIAKVSVRLGDLPVVTRGAIASEYDEARAAAIVSQPEVEIAIDLGRGAASCCVWTSDLSYDYVRINADYRS